MRFAKKVKELTDIRTQLLKSRKQANLIVKKFGPYSRKNVKFL